jgi:hypothetical protein
VSVVSELLIWLVLVLVGFHAIDRSLCMPFAVAKQDVAMFDVGNDSTAQDLNLRPREVFFASRTFIGTLTCICGTVSRDCKTEERCGLYAISRVFLHVPADVSRC